MPFLIRLAVACLFAAAPDVWAEPPEPEPSSAASAIKKAREYNAEEDENHDGTVSGGEHRRYNRRQRQANAPRRSPRSGAQGASGGEGDDEEPEVTGAAPGGGNSQSSTAKGGSMALNNAGVGAASMNAGLGGMEAAGQISGNIGGEGGPGGKAGPGAAGGTPPGAAGGAGGARAQSPQQAATGDSFAPAGSTGGIDPAMAASDGYSSAFAAAGLKLGADGKTITRLDGSAATAEDLSRLKREMDRMPLAAQRRPDFFSVIEPDRFQGLKNGLKEHPELADSVYKHVGESKDARDLIHTASCDKVSGGCNESAKSGSYKKGDFVAPEDLAKMWDKLQEALDAEDAKEEENMRRAGFRRVGAAETKTEEEPVEEGQPVRSRIPDIDLSMKPTESGAPVAAVAASVATPTPAAFTATVGRARTAFTAVAGSFGVSKENAATGFPVAVLAVGAGLLVLIGLLLKRRSEADGEPEEDADAAEGDDAA